MMKNRKYLILPFILLVYSAIMDYAFREILTVSHDYFRYFGTIAIELIVIILLAIFLKKRNKLRKEREENNI